MRIVSLVPSATEFLYELGLGDEIVGVTHECDFPAEAAGRPQLTGTVVPEALGAAEIDLAVRARTDAGKSLYTLDEELLVELEPTLIVAQQLCSVCAVSFDDVRAVAARIDPAPEVISLDPTTIGEVLGCIRTISEAANCRDAGVDLVQEYADRIDDVKIAMRNVGREDGPDPVKVAALEWLDPLFLGGHWVPQMIDLAGGIDLLGDPGERSRESSWQEIAEIEPDVVVAMQCGYDAARSLEEAHDYGDRLSALGARHVFACDGSSYFSRPGPRLVDGLELLAHTLHPDLYAEPRAGRMLPVEL